MECGRKDSFASENSISVLLFVEKVLMTAGPRQSGEKRGI